MSTRKFAVLTVLTAALLMTQADLTGQSPSSDVVAADLAASGPLWFVELASGPTADGTSLAQVRSEKAEFRRAAARAGVAFTERYAFDTLWNGLAVRVALGDVTRLAKLPGVRNIYPIEPIALPAVSSDSTPDLLTALAQTGADIAQAELGLTGRDVRVAVMDTGVDYHHPALGGCFGAGCRVAVGYDFVGDAFNADPASASYNPVAVPDADPDDCNGHGTHVAGIVGAAGEVTGVAPGVSFGAYRVFGCQGSTTADIMIAAMERALADGSDVLNMSIGSSFQWPQYPTAQAATRLVNKGMVVVASAGNSGGNGLYASGAPSLGQKVISVASMDNTHQRLPYFAVSPDGTKIGYTEATGAPPAPTAGTAAMARTGTATSAADACSALPAGSLAGQVALIRRGTCAFHLKALNAQNAGAAGVVLYNNAPGRVSPTVAGSPAITIPVVAVSDAEGVLLNNRIAAGAVTMTWTDDLESFGNATGGLISAFSSYGLSPDLTLKPDLAAPGGFIFSTYPLELGGYANISGTSMAAPHVAGAAALLLEARPYTPAQAVRGILQNSADPRVWWGNPALGFLDNVHRQGAGMLDIPGAVLSTTKVEPAKLSLGESQSGPSVQTLTIENGGANDVTYALSHAAALATGANTFTPSFFLAAANVIFDAPSVTVPAGASATINVTITAPAGLADRGLYGGYLVLTPQGGGATYRVPYAGFKGDYQAIPVLTSGGAAFPWLARLTGPSFFNQPAGGSYTFTAGDVPYILLHLDHQSRRLRFTITEVATGKSWHRALDAEYLPRNGAATVAAPGAFFALPWDGTTTAGSKLYTVPNGQYVLTVTVLKALGDDANPAHKETWVSPVITINRP